MAQAKYEIRRKCPICGAVFQIRTIDSVYCFKQCSDVAYKRKKDREKKQSMNRWLRRFQTSESFFLFRRPLPFIALNETPCIARFVKARFLL